MPYLKTETDARGVTTILLNRPERYNAMNRALMDEFSITLEKLRSNTRILVIAGDGKHFCAGADINWMKQSIELSEAENHEDAMALSNLLDGLNTFSCPTIARVHGAALGGGTGLICCCDIVVADETCTFSFSETRLGILPATISPYALAAIGARAARRYFLTGEKFDALEAYRLGLVHDVCSTDNLNNRVEEKIAELLASGPLAQSAAKRLIADVHGKPVDTALREELATRLAKIRASSEAQEGLGAFLEKRKPNW
ncbi:MAG: enoyl-CoA hydratase-related protein [Granulosicoccus sp.]